MIKVLIKKEKEKYKKIKVLGHAMYDNYGKDIVCSACSSIVTTTINGIISLKQDSLNYKITKEGLLIDAIQEDKQTQILIHNMVSLLQELENQYSKNINVKIGGEL